MQANKALVIQINKRKHVVTNNNKYNEINESDNYGSAMSYCIQCIVLNQFVG